MRDLFIAVLIVLLVVAIGLYTAEQSLAVDPPHDSSKSIGCQSCHTMHRAPGSSLTNDADNANLCLACHVSGGTASTKAFNVNMIAQPGTKGTSHSWTATMPATSNANNQYGLIATTDISNTALKARLTTYGGKITCSVCHNQHDQATTPWDPNSGSYSGAGSGSGRHFMRTGNDLNQICEDCHAYRKPATTGTDVRTYDGNKKSHPVMKIFSSAGGETPDVTNSSQFNTAPYEPLWNNTLQSGSRYHLNGGSDTDTTNNIVVDSSKKIRCLSCHGVHYTDSDSTTTDGTP